MTPEEHTAKLATGVLMELFRQGLTGADKLAKWVGEKVGEHDPLGFAVKRYGERMLEHHNQMQIFGQTKPRPLSDIVVDVEILEQPNYLTYFTPEELQERLGADERHLGRRSNPKPGQQVIEDTPKLTVLGKPGAGKTTLLKWTMVQALQGTLAFNAVPIFVPLKEWADKGITLLAYIVDQFRMCGLPEPQAMIKHMLKQGKCLVLFDGYDEVPNGDKEAIYQLQDFVKAYPTNRYLLSCRIAANHQTFVGFQLVEVADFSDDQIQAFIRRWFKDEKQAESCWIQLKERPSVKELASTPLLLTMLCLRFDKGGAFTENRAELYERSVRALLEEWDATRNVKRDQIYLNLSVRQKEMLLAQVAESTFREEKYFMHQRILKNRIGQFIAELPGSEDDKISADSYRVLKAIEANHGLLVERAEGVYSFSHLTFQEYFTAMHLEANRDEGTLDILVKDHLFDPRWREVIVLVSGLLTSRTVVDRYVLSIRRRISQFAGGSTLANFLNRCAALVEADLSHKPAASRIRLMIFALIRARVRGLAVGQDIDRVLDRSRDLAQTLDKTLVTSGFRELDLKLRLALDHALDNTLGVALIELIETYVRANRILLDCLAPYVVVSKSLREDILEGLLLE
ncbi:MAG: NACHT domain-containing protein [Bacteroidota bacterium]